jgi:hypothetical protein
MEQKKRVVKCVIDDQGKLGISAIGLVHDPAIEELWVKLSKIKLSEVQQERKMLYGAALVPDKHILRLDGNGEEFYITFEKDTIMKCAHQFLKQNLQHQHTYEHEHPVSGCVVVESWIVESENDKSRHLGLDVPVGTWMIGTKVDDESIWEEVLNGTIRGFSIEGMFNEIGLSMSAPSTEDLFIAELEKLLMESSL